MSSQIFYQFKEESNNYQLPEVDQTDCLMKKTKLYNNETAKFFQLKVNKLEKELICEECFYKCDHILEENELYIPQIHTVKDVSCACAHRKKQLIEESDTCSFKELGSALNIYFFVEINLKEMNKTTLKQESIAKIICFGCLIGCYDFPDIRYTILDKKDGLKCHCQKCNTKKLGEENLIKMLDQYKTETRVNCRKIFHTFIENSKLREGCQKEIRNLFNAIKIDSQNKTPFNELFYSIQSKLKLMQLGIKMGDIDTEIILEKDFFIQECLHYVNKFKNRQAINDSVFIGYKYYLLFFIRNLLFKPLFEQSPFAKLFNVNNSSPFHRQIFRVTFDSFIQKNRENGLEINCTLIIALLSVGQVNSIQPTDTNYVNLFIEYLKWCCLLCSLDFRTQDSNRRKEFKEMKRYIIVGLSMLSMNIRRGKVKLKKEDDQKILKYIERLFKINLIKYNDKRFFDYLTHNIYTQSLSKKDFKFFFANKTKLKSENEESDLMNELKIFYSLFFSDKQEVKVNSDIYELLLSNEDTYISSLQNIIDFNNTTYINYLYSKIIGHADIKTITRFKGSIVDIESYSNSITSIINLIKDSNREDEYLSTWINALEKKRKIAKDMHNTFTEIEEIDFIKEPYFNLLFTLYRSLKEEPILKSLLTEEKIMEVYKAIHALFEMYLSNPFILPLFFAEASIKILSSYDHITEKYYLNDTQMKFYQKAIESSIQLNYPIDLSEITTLICNSILDLSLISNYMRDNHKANNDQLIYNKVEYPLLHYANEIELINLKLKTINNILEICTKLTRMKINDLAYQYIVSLNYLNILKLEYFELNEQERQLYLGIFEILNKLNDYYYLLLPKDQIINDNLIQVISKISLKLADQSDIEDKKEINNAYITLNRTIIRHITTSSFEVKPCTIKPLLKLNDNSQLQWEVVDVIKKKITQFDQEVKTEAPQANFGFDKLLLNQTKLLKNKLEQTKKYEKYLKITIDPLIINLENFKLHCQGIENAPNEMFSHFEELILIPTTYLLYDLLYFTENINANIKYLCYKIIYLFFHCYKYFTYVIMKNFLPSSLRALKKEFKSAAFNLSQNLYLNSTSIIKETIKLIKRKFVIMNKNEELEIFFQNLHDSLEIDLLNIEKNPLDLSVLLVKYFKYASFLTRMQFLPKIKLHECVFFAFENKHNKGTNQRGEDNNSKEIYEKIVEFVSQYKEKKEDKKDNFLLNFFEQDIEEQNETYTLVIKDLSKKLVLYGNENTFNKQFFENFNYINKIFIANPNIFQKYLLDNKKQSHIIKLITSQLPLIYQYTMIDYHKLNDFKNEQQYKAIDTFVSLLEFLRLLCENHLQKMQMILAHEPFEEQFRLIHFIVQVPSLTQKHQSKSINRSYLAKYFKEHLSEYFKPLISKVIDFNIELIQGSLSGEELILNDAKQSFNGYFELYLDSATVAYESCQDPNNLFYLSEFLRFIVSFLEEPANKDADKRELINYFNGNRIIDFMVFCTKELYLNLPNKIECKNKKDTDFINELRQGYIEHYHCFQNNLYFTIAFYSMKYLEFASSLCAGSRINILMKEAKARFKDNAHIYDLWSEVTFRFFFQIMKTVELSLQFTYYDLEDKTIQKEAVVQNTFLVHPDVQLVTQEDYNSFYEEAPFEDQNLKLGFLLKFIPKLEEMIITRKSIKNQPPIVDILSRMNYKLSVKITALVALITSFLIMFSSSYVIMGPNEFPLNPEMIEKNETNSNLIFWIGIAHLIFLFCVCSNWLYFMVYVLNKTKKEKAISTFSSIMSFCSGIQFLLFWNLFWGILSLSPVLRFCHSFQLFALFGLFDTMKTVLISVKMRYKQFISAALLIVIFSLFFASLKYSLFCVDNTAEECVKFSFSFLNMITSGIRAGNNVGFGKVSISDGNYYWYFLIEWVFYFILILVMLNIINGIIVDTFQEQREKNNERIQAKENICYICNTGRSYFEKAGINYEDHINCTHSIIHYFEYIVSLKRINALDLNSLDSLILDQFKQNQTGFFPQC